MDCKYVARVMLVAVIWLVAAGPSYADDPVEADTRPTSDDFQPADDARRQDDAPGGQADAAAAPDDARANDIERADDATSAVEPVVPESPAEMAAKASEHFKRLIAELKSLEVSLNATLLANQDLTAKKQQHDVALQAAVRASAKVNELKARLMIEVDDAAKQTLEDELVNVNLERENAEQAYGAARTRLEIAEKVHAQNLDKLNEDEEHVGTSYGNVFESIGTMRDTVLEVQQEAPNERPRGQRNIRDVVKDAVQRYSGDNPSATTEGTTQPPNRDTIDGARKRGQRPVQPSVQPGTSNGEFEGSHQPRRMSQVTEAPREPADVLTGAPGIADGTQQSAASVVGTLTPPPHIPRTTLPPPNRHVRKMDPPATQFQHVDAFQKLPLVQKVRNARDAREFVADESERAEGDEILCDYRFDRPAHFAVASFGLAGETIEEPGLIIYEGMRLAVKSDGRYEVRFVVGTPAIPVDMKLQLLLEDQDTLERYTLTLPRVAIPTQDEPQFSSQRREVETVYRSVHTVHHEGYLPILAQKPQSIRVVRRTGTARFGFGVNVP